MNLLPRLFQSTSLTSPYCFGLATGECPDAVYISSQADIDHGNFTCNSSDSAVAIYIRNAAGNLDIRRFVSVETVDVQDSPNLESLSLPNLSTLSRLRINNATSLSNISLPHLTPGLGLLTDGNSPPVSNVNFNITGTPLLSSITFGNLSSFFSLSLANSGQYGDLFRSVVSVYNLVIDGCFDFSDVQFVQNLQITGDGFCPYTFRSLASVQNLTLANVDFRYLSSSLRVNGSLVVESSDYSTDNSVTNGPEDVPNFSTVGSDVNVTANSNAELLFSQLTTIGGNLIIHSNTNCTLGFDQLSDVTALSMIDNMNTSLPWFPMLQRADNIHLRGHIDT